MNGSMTKSFYAAGVVKVSPQEDSEVVRSPEPHISKREQLDYDLLLN